MKKIIISSIVIIIGLVSIGCSATWDGVKKDSGDAYDSTKKAIHNATD